MKPGRHPTPEQLLDPTPGAEVVAHLEECAQCRVEVRLLREVFETEPDELPGIDAARTTMETLRATLTTTLEQSGTFVTDAEPRETLRMERDGAAETLPVIGPGVEVDHFRVVRAIGRGGMGEVFLARDTRLGRKVALKVLRSGDLGSSRAVERFLFEARTTARFSHPHIVAIHAVGEHRGNPYVALEYLEGQTLRARLVEQRLGLREVLRIGRAIAEALEEAHRHRVLHRDLKPENVMIPRDGRLRVLDFGLARVVPGEDLAFPGDDPTSATWSTEIGPGESFETRAGGLRGTPPYMAPEQWEGGEVTGATDVWALGMILHEALAGRHPFAGADAYQLCFRVPREEIPPLDDPDLPSELVQLVHRCLDRDPDRRPGVGTLVETLAALGATGRPVRAAEAPPFRGLLPCDERDADRFFGRDAEIAAFLERLRHEPVLPVVGTSGSGKSSFVQAGVIPRLREQGRWAVLRLRPGRSPMRALAAALLRGDTVGSSASGRSIPSGEGGSSPSGLQGQPGELDEQERALSDELSEAPARLALTLGQLADRRRARVLLYVDQLEELYTQVPDEALRRTFLEAVCLAADDPHGPVRVVFTLRDDFLGKLALGPAAREALGHVSVLRSPGEDSLRQILTRPLDDAGYRYDDPTLVDEMVAAVRNEPAALPLLQVTGQGLWARRDRDRRLLLREAHDAMGGVAGALAHHADGVLDGLGEGRTHLARALLLRLVRADGTRRVQPREALLDGLGTDAPAVLDHLVQGRLVLVRQAKRGGRRSRDGEAEPTVREGAELELVHESLIRTWDRLARWIDESREERVVLAELEQAAELWLGRGARPEEVWSGDALHDALRRAERLPAVPEAVRRFLDAGRRLDQRRTRQRRALLVAAFAVLALIAAVLAWTNRAVRQQRDRAEEGQAEALLAGARTSALRGELLEARAQLRSSLEIRDSVAGRTLWWQLRHDPLVWRMDLGLFPQYVSFAPDGETLAVARQDGLVQRYDVETRLATNLRGLTAPIWAVAHSPDGRWIAASAHRGQIGIWDAATGEGRVIESDARAVTGVAFHPESAFLATSGTRGTLRLWDPATGELLRELDHPDVFIRCLDVSPDGAWIATGSKDQTARIWHAATGELHRELKGHEGRVQVVRFSPDGGLLATAGNDRVIRLWDTAEWTVEGELAGHTDTVYALGFDPESQLLASGGRDGAVRLWDVPGRSALRTLGHHESWIWAVAFHPDGQRLASVGQDYLVQLWDRRAGTLPEPRGHTAGVVGVAFAPDGERLISAGYDNRVRIWDRRTGAQLLVSGEAPEQLNRVRVSPDGQEIVAACMDHTLRRYDTTTLEALGELSGHAGVVFELVYDPAGRWLASGDWQGVVHLWDAADGSPLRQLHGLGPAITGMAVRPDGAQLAVVGKNTTPQLWDPSSGRVQRTLTGALARAAVYDPAGERLFTVNDAGEVHRWALAGGAPTRLAAVEDASIYDVEIDPGGRWLAVAADDGVARLIDADDGTLVELRGHRGEVNDVAFSADGSALATGSDDATVRLWDPATGQAMWASGEAGGDDAGPPEDLPEGITATAPIGSWIARGYADGAIELEPATATGEPPRFNLEDLPSSQVEQLGAGPRGTLLAGFADGTVGIWSTTNGARLFHLKLHGPVTRLVLEQGQLSAETDLGDRQDLDLSILEGDYCALMQSIWAEVPVLWEDGIPVARDPDPAHLCR